MDTSSEKKLELIHRENLLRETRFRPICGRSQCDCGCGYRVKKRRKTYSDKNPGRKKKICQSGYKYANANIRSAHFSRNKTELCIMFVCDALIQSIIFLVSTSHK